MVYYYIVYIIILYGVFMANSKPVIYSDFSDSPQFLKEFLYYNQTIKGLSARTVEAYYLDFRYTALYPRLSR